MAKDRKNDWSERYLPGRRRLLKAGAGILGGAALGMPAIVVHRPALASNWPTKQVRVVVPYSPGGNADILSRLMAQQLTKQLGQSFVVENKAGAAATIGAADVARAPNDGYNVLTITPTFVITQYAYAQLPYDGKKDFTPVGVIISSPLVLVTHPSLNIKTPADYIKAAKANPGKVSYSSSGAGSVPHLAGELLKLRANIDILHVPYKGGGPAITALLSGEVSSYFGTPIELNDHIKNGRLVAVASTAAKRTPGLPNLPTMIESGIPDFDLLHFTGFLMRAGTPADTIAKFSNEFQSAKRDPQLNAKLAAAGDVTEGTVAEASAMLATAHERWAPAVKAANVKFG